MAASAVPPAGAVAELRASLHGLWSAVATAWGDHADYVDARGAAMTTQMLERTDPRPGERVLELACGAGGVGLAAAAHVGDRGEVVVSDVAPEMVAVANGRARELGLRNVSGRTLDLEAIDEPDEFADVVLCRDGLMFVTDPARATSEIRRVLRPGGRAAVAVWGPRARNPWLGLVLDAVSAELGAPVPPPGIPGPFSLGDDGVLARALTAGGLIDVTIAELDVPLLVSSFDEWWRRTTALAGPVANLLRIQPDETTRAITARARELTAPYEHDGAFAFPGVALLGSARRAPA